MKLTGLLQARISGLQGIHTGFVLHSLLNTVRLQPGSVSAACPARMNVLCIAFLDDLRKSSRMHEGKYTCPERQGQPHRPSDSAS
eukprot:1137576-Pelagomonas_calceolata.AAC.4